MYQSTYADMQSSPVTYSVGGNQTGSDGQDPLNGNLGKHELFLDENGKPHISFVYMGNARTMDLKSEEFARLLIILYYDFYRKAIPTKQIKKIVDLLCAQAFFESNVETLFTRVGTYKDSLYIDLCTPGGEIVEVSPHGWRVQKQCPVKFWRCQSMRDLPIPQRGGTLDMLRPYLNVASETDFRLLVGWIISCFCPDGAKAVLILQGEQGSAKSTLSWILRSLVCPSVTPVSALPQSERNLMLIARSTFLLVFDNISGLSQKIANLLCQISTGLGCQERALYTNSQLISFSFTRAMILNGITDFVTQPDLIDRSFIVHLPTMSKGQRKDENRLKDDFEKDRPLIFGAILDALVAAMAMRNQIDIECDHRMKHLIRFVTAAESVFGWSYGEFENIVMKNRCNALVGNALDDDLGRAVRNLMLKHDEWMGSPHELLSTLKDGSPELVKCSEFPKSPQQLTPHLKRLIPGLRLLGIFIQPPTKPEYHKNSIKTERLYRIQKQSCQSQGEDNDSTSEAA